MSARHLIQASASQLPLASESVQTVVTSPPYWGLRQYAGEQIVPEWGCALGLEPTPELYVEHMVAIFREVRRVLRRDGTLWLNLGDSYAAANGSLGRNDQDRHRSDPRYRPETRSNRVGVPNQGAHTRPLTPGLKPKDLVGIPWMVAFALRADGWYLRSDIIWHKPNPMPESVTDRPTKSHEYLFLLSKSERYFYDADAIREALSPTASYGGKYRSDSRDASDQIPGNAGKPAQDMHRAGVVIEPDPRGRNKRTVWTIATRPYPGAHFATYPEQLVEPCILAGSSPKACGICGAPWERVTERGETTGRTAVNGHGNGELAAAARFGDSHASTLGWRSTCEHDDDSGACVVLDPFNGSGTTGRVAIRHGRSYVGVDISSEYLVEQATKRIDNIQHAMGL